MDLVSVFVVFVCFCFTDFFYALLSELFFPCFVYMLMFLCLQVPPQMGQMGGVQVMAPQPVMYNQPVLRPTNPFAPMPGAQVIHQAQYTLSPAPGH